MKELCKYEIVGSPESKFSGDDVRRKWDNSLPHGLLEPSTLTFR